MFDGMTPSQRAVGARQIAEVYAWRGDTDKPPPRSSLWSNHTSMPAPRNRSQIL
jgi:hypothetical protein